MKRLVLILIGILCFVTVTAKGQSEIVVKTAEELIGALGPNRTIVIDSRVPLMLTPAIMELADQGRLYEYDYYQQTVNANGLGWYDNFDGMGLSITGYDNLTIKSKGSRKATLLVQPRYADVLLFENCNNLVLENLVLGHTETGSCQAGVLELISCTNVQVKGCDLFGCGTEAIIIADCMYVDVVDTEMHHCSYHSLHVDKSSHVRFKDCKIHDNREYEQINVFSSNDVWFEGCDFMNLLGKLFNLNCTIDLYDCVIDRCDDSDMSLVTSHGERVSPGEEWSSWIQVTGSDVNLRNTPSFDGEKQSMKLRKGEFAQKIDSSGDWVKIYQPYSTYGYAWINNQYAKDVPVEAVPEMVRECMPIIDMEGVEAVDLGLSVEWSSANYGAGNCEQYGEFMSWPLAMDQDFPYGWRLPTDKEWKELLSLPYEMEELPSGIRVAKFKAPNGRTISIATNGYIDEDVNQDFGFFGFYWTSSRTADATYPLGFIVNAPYSTCRVDKLIDGLYCGLRLVRDKAK